MKKLHPGDRVRINDDVGPEGLAGQETVIIARLLELSDGVTAYSVGIEHPNVREVIVFNDELTLLEEDDDTVT